MGHGHRQGGAGPARQATMAIVTWHAAPDTGPPRDSSVPRWPAQTAGAQRRRAGIFAGGPGAPEASSGVYLTVTVLAAEVFDALECVTRTRILYLPFTAGAFHVSV